MKSPITNYFNLKRDFYKEHPRVEKRTWEEIDKFLNLHQIKFSGFDFPKPIFSLDEINFPNYIQDEFKMQGIHKPSAIQSMTWPALYSGRDIMCIGLPTASRVISYICPALVFIKEQPTEIRKTGPLVLIVTQTKEVAKEILTQSQMFMHQSLCSFCCLFDDENINTQSLQLREREHDIIIGNYHRLCELLDNELINLKNVSFLIMDDFYRNRSARLSDEIKRVVNETRTDRQTAIFSRIVPSGLQKSNGDEFQNDALFVCIGNDDIHVSNRDLPQTIHICTMAEKRKKLQDIITEIAQQEKNFKILVYANGFKKIRITEKIVKELRIDTFAYERTSVGRRRRAMKEKVYYNFNATPNSVLVASDVVSSKVELPDLNYIINADFPVNLSLYLNRMRMPNARKYISIFIAEDARHADRLIYVLNECRQEVPPILYKISEAYINSGKDVDRMPSLFEISEGITKPVEKPIPKPLPPTVSHTEITPAKRPNRSESESTSVNEPSPDETNNQIQNTEMEINTNIQQSSSSTLASTSVSSMSPNELSSSSSSSSSSISSINITLNKTNIVSNSSTNKDSNSSSVSNTMPSTSSSTYLSSPSSNSSNSSSGSSYKRFKPTHRPFNHSQSTSSNQFYQSSNTYPYTQKYSNQTQSNYQYQTGQNLSRTVHQPIYNYQTNQPPYPSYYTTNPPQLASYYAPPTGFYHNQSNSPIVYQQPYTTPTNGVYHHPHVPHQTIYQHSQYYHPNGTTVNSQQINNQSQPVVNNITNQHQNLVQNGSINVKNEPLEYQNRDTNEVRQAQWSPYFTNPMPFKQEPSEPGNCANTNKNSPNSGDDKNAINIVTHLLKDKQILNQLEKVAQTFRLSN